MYFVHIPKTAGTTIEVLAENENILWGLKYKFKYPDLSFGGISNWHVPHIINPYPETDTFTVVRNPYDRLISEYKWRLKKSRLFKSRLFKYVNNVDNFNDWISSTLVNNNLRYFAIDGHLIPQHHFTHDKMHVRIIDTIIRFERLEVEFNHLMESRNMSLRIKQVEPLNLYDEICLTNITPSNLIYINEYYKYDFELLNYEMK
jgi:hypothetical protein